MICRRIADRTARALCSAGSKTAPSNTRSRTTPVGGIQILARASDSGIVVWRFIDLSDRGLQPMSSADGATWIVFNGEIYNFRELRSELESRGYGFKTGTDTEVLLQAYLHWGEDCLERLQGMYGFAIWDGRRGRLFCARDRLGIKPFYYATPKGYFVFASEIKGLLPFPGVEVEADDDAVVGFLVHGNCDYGERTILKGVKALPAGHALTLDVATAQLAIKRYWSLNPNHDSGAPASPTSEANMDDERVAALRDRLLDTMRRHLISDVRAGSCLSGGLDSSVVVGLIGKIQSEQPEAASAVGENLYTFTSCYEYKEIDEREYALAVANDIKAKAHLVFPSAEDFWSDFERMAWHQDMPFNGLAYYAQWRVMRAAKEAGVKVLLDGQGGDEVFGGYAKFRYAYMASLLRSGRFFRFAREVGAMIKQGDSRYVAQYQERIPLPPEERAPSAQSRLDAASGYEGGLESSRRRQQQPRDALVAQRRRRAERRWRRDCDAAHSDRRHPGRYAAAAPAHGGPLLHGVFDRSPRAAARSQAGRVRRVAARPPQGPGRVEQVRRQTSRPRNNSRARQAAQQQTRVRRAGPPLGTAGFAQAYQRVDSR